MKINAIIPARLGSYRFPTKSMEDILGMPVVVHVFKRTQLCNIIDEVYVATPDKEIADCVGKFGGKSILTAGECRRGTDRVYKASEQVGGDIIINVQGDEPMVTPELIELAVETLLDDSSLSCVNLFKYITLEEARDKNESKIVTDANDIALYYSREPIPTTWLGNKEIKYKAEIGVMPFTSASLRDFANLPNGYLEEIESNDMLRFTENGRKVKVIESPNDTLSIDVPEDLARVRKMMENDALLRKYLP